uniref:General secretion pathway protein F n=1 Tax=Malawimonas jakobiformis TaxID=136089 RepID=A0A895KQ72_MALJA|nr:general secretion pathway protein F [Malawimonas jakobiformis]
MADKRAIERLKRLMDQMQPRMLSAITPHLAQSATGRQVNFIYKVIRSLQGSGSLSSKSLQAFNNILFLVNSIPQSMNSFSIFDIILRSSSRESDLLPFLAQLKIPKSALGGTDYKTFIATLSRVQQYLPSWYYSALVLGRALGSFDKILLFCAQKLARDIRISASITGGLAYPAFMVTLSVVAIAVLSVSIIPQHIQTFEGMGLPVPALLRYFNYLMNMVPYHWFALAVLVPWSFSAQYLPFKTFMRLEYIRMHTPLGHLRFLEDKAMLLHMLSLLDKEQLSSKLILVCTNISGNPVLQDMVEQMAAQAKYGGNAEDILSFLLKQKHVFTPYEIAYLQACILSGKHSIVQDGLRYVSQMVMKEYNTRLQSLLKVVSPVTTLLVGVLVAMIAVLGIGPLVQLTDALKL